MSISWWGSHATCWSGCWTSCLSAYPYHQRTGTSATRFPQATLLPPGTGRSCQLAIRPPYHHRTGHYYQNTMTQAYVQWTISWKKGSTNHNNVKSSTPSNYVAIRRGGRKSTFVIHKKNLVLQSTKAVFRPEWSDLEKSLSTSLQTEEASDNNQVRNGAAAQFYT